MSGPETQRGRDATRVQCAGGGGEAPDLQAGRRGLHLAGGTQLWHRVRRVERVAGDSGKQTEISGTSSLQRNKLNMEMNSI